MSAPVRLGLIGCGRLAEAGYAPAAALVPGLELVAVADPDPERRAALLAALAAGARDRDGRAPTPEPFPHSSAEALIGAGGLDGVVIASPPAHHEAAARAAAGAGLPALVEKPPAPDAAGAERIAALDPPPFVGFNRRFSLGAGIAGALPEGGTALMELRYRRFSWAPVSVRDPALLDLAPHLVDLALLAGVGAPREVVARSRRPERVTLELRGARGRARLRCACDRFHLERVEVRDASGRALVRRREGGALRGVAARLRPGPHPLVASLARQLDALALACRNGPGAGRAAGLATARDGVDAMRVVEAAAESLARAGEAVPVRAPGRAAA